MPTTEASSRASSLAPSPAQPPTRMCWSTPSLMMARGSPLATLNTMMSPQ